MNFLLKLGVVVLPIPFAIMTYDKPFSRFWLILHVLALSVYSLFGSIGQYILLVILSGIIFSIYHGIMSAIKTPNSNKKKPSDQKTKVTQAPHPEDLLSSLRTTALYKLAQQILDDDKVELDEAKKLQAWFKRYPESAADRRTKALVSLTEEVLSDKELNNVEALDLFVGLSDYCEAYEVAREKQNKPALNKFQQPNFNHPALRQLKDIELGKEYYMKYLDSAGDVSQRNIILRSVKVNKQGQPTIGGYCLLRKASRTFRADRIKSLCSTETGEVFV